MAYRGQVNLYIFANVAPDTAAASFVSTIRATAQSGVTYGTQSRPGAFITVYGLVNNSGIVVNLYRGGVLVDSGSGVTNSTGSGGSPAELYVMLPVVTQPFDAVEIVATASVGQNVIPNDTPYLRVYELCSDGGYN